MKFTSKNESSGKFKISLNFHFFTRISRILTDSFAVLSKNPKIYDNFRKFQISENFRKFQISENFRKFPKIQNLCARASANFGNPRKIDQFAQIHENSRKPPKNPRKPRKTAIFGHFWALFGTFRAFSSKFRFFRKNFFVAENSRFSVFFGSLGFPCCARISVGPSDFRRHPRISERE